MKIVIYKSKFNSYIVTTILFFTFLIDSFFSSEFAFGIFLGFFLIVNLRFGIKYNLEPIFVVLFVTIFVTGVTIGLLEYGMGKGLKDVWYFGKPVLYFIGGAYIYRHFGSTIPVIKIFLSISALSALVYLIPIMGSYQDFFILGPDEFRDKYGKGSVLFVFSIVTLFYFYGYRLFSRPRLLFFLLLILLSLVLTQSRLSILMLLIFIFASCKNRFVHVLFTVFLFSLILFFTLPKENTTDVVSDRHSFVGKLISSLSELRPQNYVFERDIHTNWRGYETYAALSQYSSGEFFSKIFGYGFGSTVYIDFDKRGGAGEKSQVRLSSLDWLHNGYVTVLLKTGILGVVIYILFSFRLLYFCLLRKSENIASSVALCFLYYFIVATFLVGGIFAKSGVMILLFTFGFLIEHIKGSLNESFISTSER